MSNYSLVVNSQFKPFSYAEMLQPVLQATQAHQALEDAYGELSQKANVWEEMANEQTDPYAYKMYKTYANDLENQAGQLAREGLNVSSRRDMLNMRTRYNKEIVPIEQAYTARQKQAEAQQQALLQDPTMMFSRRAATTSLDDYIRNPQLDYTPYSGKLITAQAAQAASALSKEMIDNPRKWRSILGNSYYETVMQKGFSSAAVLQAIQNNPNAAPELLRIVEDAVNSSGVREWNDKASLDRAYDFARQGLWSAVGETQYQNLDNWRAKMAAQEAMQIRAENRAAAAARQQASAGDFAINPLNLYSSRELSQGENDYKFALEHYSKYFYRDPKSGEWKLNWEGVKEYNRKQLSHSGKTETTPEGVTILTSVEEQKFDSPFKKFVDKLRSDANPNARRLIYHLGKDNFAAQKGVIGKMWGEYIKESPSAKTSKYDAMKVTEFDYSIDSSNQGDMKDAIMTANRGLDLYEVDFDNKSKTFKETGHTITTEDLKNDKYKVTATRFSPYGNTVMIQDDEGSVKRYRMPVGINSTNEHNRDEAMKAAYQWQQLVNTGQYTDSKGNTHTATPEEVSYAQDQYRQSLQRAYLFHSQLGVQNKTKTQEYSPYGY